jgi:hypothetical protein
LDVSSEVCEDGIGFFLTRGDSWVFFCLVVVDERFKADLVGSMSEVVESTLDDCKSGVADVGLFKLSVTL